MLMQWVISHRQLPTRTRPLYIPMGRTELDPYSLHLLREPHTGFPKIHGYFLEVPVIRDYSRLGSIPEGPAYGNSYMWACGALPVAAHAQIRTTSRGKEFDMQEMRSPTRAMFARSCFGDPCALEGRGLRLNPSA